MINLTTNEKRVFANILTNVIPKLAPGIYFAKDFFGVEPVCPRIVRRLYEEVAAGAVVRTSLRGTKSADGYIIV